jgi:hypothetical protein
MRLANGKFWNLSDDDEMATDVLKEGFLPPKPIDEKTCQMGRVLLEAMGVKVGKFEER